MGAREEFSFAARVEERCGTWLMASRGIAAALCLLLLGAAPALGAEVEPSPGVDAENDPLEPLNRLTFELNRRVLWYTARPIADGYRWIVPRPVRDGFRNGLDNLGSPMVFGNQILQGDAGAAARTLARLFVNSTVGLGGTIDVAKRIGIPRRHADLGLTLGVWGIGEGPYLVLPLLGPTTPRDMAVFAQGMVDPFNFLVQNTDYAFDAFLLRFVFGNIDLYARRMNELDAIEESSVDFYAALRDLYRQKRRADIRKITAAEPIAPTGIDYDLEPDDDDPVALDEPVPEGSASP